MATNNIVLIHGLWMTPLSFEYWAHHYSEQRLQRACAELAGDGA